MIFFFLSFFLLKEKHFHEQSRTIEREGKVGWLAWKICWCIVQHCFRTSMPLGGSPERWRHHRGNRWLVCPQWKNGWVAHIQSRRRVKHEPNVKLPHGLKHKGKMYKCVNIITHERKSWILQHANRVDFSATRTFKKDKKTTKHRSTAKIHTI